jgi:hypothetical protein
MNKQLNQPIYEINFGEKIYSFDLSQNEKSENCVIVSLPGKILVIELKVNFLEVFFKEYFLEFGFIEDG